MSLAHKFNDALKRALLGDTALPQGCNLGLCDPQTEIVVWLHGMGAPRDVTQRHCVACAAPPIICIGFDREDHLDTKPRPRLSLHFCERGNEQRLLGKIDLRPATILPIEGAKLRLFEAVSATNFCLPRHRLWAHYVYYAYHRWRKRESNNVRVSGFEQRTNAIMFICPRPVALVSLFEAGGGNIFPMNLMGSLGKDRFAFALVHNRWPASLVKRIGQIALSTIPFEHFAAARSLGKNHRQESIEWSQLPFSTHPSPNLGFPIPEFANRVREMKVELVQELGSHTFFVARILHDERYAQTPEFFMIHGLYAARRQVAQASAYSTTSPMPARQQQ